MFRAGIMIYFCLYLLSSFSVGHLWQEDKGLEGNTVQNYILRFQYFGLYVCQRMKQLLWERLSFGIWRRNSCIFKSF